MMTQAVVQFCQILRDHGFSAGVKETLDSLSAAILVNVSDRQAFKSALRSILVTSKQEFELFDLLFENYWQNLSPDRLLQKQSSNPVPKQRNPEGSFTRAISEVSADAELEEHTTTGASAVERLKKTDFSQIPLADLPLLEQIALQLWKRMSMRLIRRWRMHEKMGPVDLRRTIRQSISHGGEPVELMRKGRNKKKMRLVVLLDVSGSMDLYSAFLLRFVYALNLYFHRVDSFLFSTRLIPVSRTLRKEHLTAVLSELSETVQEWSGGTRIGECLREFNSKFAPGILNRNAIVIILSDGWDTGSPELLSDQLLKMKRRARKIIWLNPLLGLSGYEPLTKGIVAAMPYTDQFVPAHNLESLLQLEQYWS
jgi:uncharacterized protein with von Willebrand factor type A (vWA) domain